METAWDLNLPRHVLAVTYEPEGELLAVEGGKFAAGRSPAPATRSTATRKADVSTAAERSKPNTPTSITLSRTPCCPSASMISGMRSRMSLL